MFVSIWDQSRFITTSERTAGGGRTLSVRVPLGDTQCGSGGHLLRWDLQRELACGKLGAYTALVGEGDRLGDRAEHGVSGMIAWNADLPAGRRSHQQRR